MKKHLPIAILLFFCIAICSNCTEVEQQTQEKEETIVNTIEKRPFGQMPSGEKVEQYILKNQNDVEIRIINYGAIVTHIITPDKNGNRGDITHGFDSLSGYLGEHPYFGAIVGRYGNRIAKGQFSIEGESYQLATNNYPNHLHGGLKGFDKKMWQANIIEGEQMQSLQLKLLSEDGDEGYPGNLETQVTFTLNDDNELRMDYRATTDKTTHANLTNHSYFNLSGDLNNTILQHELMIQADHFTPVDETLIPTGEIQSLDNSPLDFRRAKPIGTDINAEDEQMKRGLGYDHCWVLKKTEDGGDLQLAARVHEPESGRVLEVLTTEPGIQFYSGNFLDGTVTGKKGVSYQYRTGLCLETEHYPDSPNQENFPSTLLKPGEVYQTSTIYKFSVK